MFGTSEAGQGALEDDIESIGHPVFSADTYFRMNGLTREIEVVVQIDADEVSAELLTRVIEILNEHDDIDYKTGILNFVRLDWEFLSITSAAEEIGLPHRFVSTGAFRFTRGRIHDFLQQS